MAAAKTTSSRDLTAEVGYLTRALKAPTLRETVGRLAERARAESWLCRYRLTPSELESVESWIGW